MAQRPEKLSQRPGRAGSRASARPTPLDLHDPRADVLSDVMGSTLLRNSLYRRIEGHAPWGLRMPARERTVFHVLARGTALLEVEGEEPVWLSAGDVALITHGTTHTLRDAATTRPERVCDGQHRHDERGPRRLGGQGAVTSLLVGFFEYSGARKPALLERMPRLLVITAEESSRHSWLTMTLQLFVAESTLPGPASALVVQRLADVLFLQTLRALALRSECQRHGLPALLDPSIREALALLHGRVNAPWTVAQLASRVGLSRSAFAARFTALVGEPPLQYLARWRMARAAELLRGTDDAVSAIAERVGYESVPSFLKAFKRWQGESPGAFRRQHRAEAAEAAEHA